MILKDPGGGGGGGKVNNIANGAIKCSSACGGEALKSNRFSVL